MSKPRRVEYGTENDKAVIGKMSREQAENGLFHIKFVLETISDNLKALVQVRAQMISVNNLSGIRRLSERVSSERKRQRELRWLQREYKNRLKITRKRKPIPEEEIISGIERIQ